MKITKTEITEMYERIAIISMEKFSIENLNTIEKEFGAYGLKLYKQFLEEDKNG